MKSAAAVLIYILVFTTSGIARGPAIMAEEKDDSATERKKHPKTACCLSYIIPGQGQIYNGEYRKAAGFLSAFAVMAGMIYIGLEDNTNSSPAGPGFEFGGWRDIDNEGDDAWASLGILGYFLLSALSSADAYHSAKRINEQQKVSAILIPSKRQVGLRFSMGF